MNNEMGRLIVLEGADGAGKSTVLQEILNEFELKGTKYRHFSFPGRTKGSLGELVYRIHHHHANEFGVDKITPTALQALHIAAHLDLIEMEIIPSLTSGHLVLMDRYWWSTWVYGRLNGALSGVIDGLVEAEVRAWGDSQPNRVFLLDREESLKEEGEANWAGLRKLYLELARREQSSYSVEVIENSSTAADAAAQILDKLAL